MGFIIYFVLGSPWWWFRRKEKEKEELATFSLNVPPTSTNFTSMGRLSGHQLSPTWLTVRFGTQFFLPLSFFIILLFFNSNNYHQYHRHNHHYFLLPYSSFSVLIFCLCYKLPTTFSLYSLRYAPLEVRVDTYVPSFSALEHLFFYLSNFVVHGNYL